MDDPREVIDHLKKKVERLEKELGGSEKMLDIARNAMQQALRLADGFIDHKVSQDLEIDRQNQQIVSQRKTIAHHLSTISSLQDKLVGRGPSPLLSLPPEILELVVANVPPADSFFLSQTCQTLRALAFQRWKGKVEFPNGEKKFTFLLAVALRLDDAWACLFCEKIHFADVRYMPGTTLYFQKSCYRGDPVKYHIFGPARDTRENNDEDDSDCGSLDGMPKVWKKLEYRQVQLALKYILRGERHKARPFLKAHAHSESAESFFKEKQGKMHFYFQPKIIDGRYIAYTEYTLQVTQNRLIYLSDLHEPIYLDPCLHEHHDHTNKGNGRGLYLIGNRGVEKTASCKHCASDFAYISEGDRYQVRTWRYFGQYYRDVAAFSMQADSKRPTGQKFLGEHVAGSVRKLWEEAD
ncbi:hypothetical protein B0T11DRAFT_283711 [Plectosphaerella cucumerina]|uniref:F-box domain-containing protein n=1 Tax=Plectosphaerella cucumerina TaxID=40658 RepID=A0A8K0X0X6_9PEZI|nr:hypothetical protein B0T11DRAFT_283711 [Plectosphaerella cucumerina]